MAQGSNCPNFNHRRGSVSVRFCPDCGKVVNPGILTKKCSEAIHAKSRHGRSKYCAECGELLIRENGVGGTRSR
jgi:hypothetical protein